MPRPFRRNHNDIEILARHDLVVVNIESVSKGEGCPFFDVRHHFAGIHARNIFVGQQHHYDIGAFDRLCDFFNLEAGLYRLAPGSAAFAQTHRDLDAGVGQILGMRMALRAIADDRHLFAFDEREVGVLVVIHFHVLPFNCAMKKTVYQQTNGMLLNPITPGL